jgi:hypothetical protein
VLDILGMAIDVFESVQLAIGSRHQLDHADFRMACGAGGFFELLPAQEVSADVLGQLHDERLGADGFDQNADIGGIEGPIPARNPGGRTVSVGVQYGWIIKDGRHMPASVDCPLPSWDCSAAFGGMKQ